MRDRTAPVARAGRRPTAASLDIACCSASGRHFVVLVPAAGRRGARALPWAPLAEGAALDASAERLVRATLGVPAAWIAQVGAFGDGRRHPSTLPLSVGFVAIVPAATAAPEGWVWVRIAECDGLAPRQQAILAAAVALLRDRMDLAPVAFRLLPPTFTLSELQEMYELLLGRRLHKASFRRALQAAYLVEPTDEWRSEGRGRPAQLFRYAPRRKRGARRPVRFELLG